MSNQKSSKENQKKDKRTRFLFSRRHCAPIRNNDAFPLEYERHQMDISSTCNLSAAMYRRVPEDVTVSFVFSLRLYFCLRM
jgi:hypothetical protein